jgi:hypothetical protein
MRTGNRILRVVLALMTSAALVAGCGGDDGGAGGGGEPVTDAPVPTATVPTATEPDAPEPTATEPAGTASQWSAAADGVCRETYEGRGRPPQARSGDLDDDMALAENWRGNLAFRAARDLADLSDPPAGARELVIALLEYQKASVRIAEVYLEGGYQPTKTAAAEAVRDEARTSVESLSVELDTPSCARVVNTDE